MQPNGTMCYDTNQYYKVYVSHYFLLVDDDSASARGDNHHQEYYKHDGRFQNNDFTRKLVRAIVYNKLHACFVFNLLNHKFCHI